MRDNIKPVEAKFFKYCMKRLCHTDIWPDGTVGTIMTMRQMIVDFSNRYDIPYKVIESIVNKWDGWFLDVCYRFNPYRFPAEYIALIPRRTLRKCSIFGMIAKEENKKGLEYRTVFNYKTYINGLADTDAIFENIDGYWSGGYNAEKYDKAILYINKEIDKTDEPPRDYLVVQCLRYIINYYESGNADDVFRDAHRVNETARTINKATKYLYELNNKDDNLINNLNDLYHYILGEE